MRRRNHHVLTSSKVGGIIDDEQCLLCIRGYDFRSNLISLESLTQCRGTIKKSSYLYDLELIVNISRILVTFTSMRTNTGRGHFR